jgi:DNA-binding NtrC family response regulator
MAERIALLQASRAADLPTVLIEGETGTGKDLMARWLHLRSQLAAQPFVEIDCASLPVHLLQAELFGYEKGAFTDARASKGGLVEMAEGGTLFVNDVGDLSLDAQTKLLTLIERKTIRRLGGLREKAVDVRIIAATVPSRALRENLWHRLNVLTVPLPPLRERGEDVVLLARHFLRTLGRMYGANERYLGPSAVAALRSHSWPGNVRELRHALERAVFLSQDLEISAEALVLRTPTGERAWNEHAAGGPSSPQSPGGGYDLGRAERVLIERALAATGGNVSEAARRLGIGREALRYRLRKHGFGGKGHR